MNRHERRRHQKLKPIAVSTAPSAQIPIDDLGPAGIPGELSILAILSGEVWQDSERLIDQSPRSIKVYAVLSKVPPISEHIKGDTTADDGASYLSVPPAITHVGFTGSGGNFTVKKNHANELSFVEFEYILKASERILLSRPSSIL